MTFTTVPSVDRFWAKVEKTETCWLWTAHKNAKGYGTFWDGERTVLAYRWAFEDANGPIPAHLRLDHLCRVHACVNPDHLEPVTDRENILRGEGACANNARKARCPRGHEYATRTVHRARTGFRPEVMRWCPVCQNEAKKRGRAFHTQPSDTEEG